MNVNTGTTKYAETDFQDPCGHPGTTYVTLTEWPNGEGAELHLHAPKEDERRFSLTWEEARAVVKLVTAMLGAEDLKPMTDDTP